MAYDLEASLNNHLHISICAWFYIFAIFFSDMMEIMKLLDFFFEQVHVSWVDFWGKKCY